MKKILEQYGYIYGQWGNIPGITHIAGETGNTGTDGNTEMTYDEANRMVTFNGGDVLYDEENIRMRTVRGMMLILPTAGQRKKHTIMETGWYMRRAAVMRKRMETELTAAESSSSFTTTTISAVQP